MIIKVTKIYREQTFFNYLENKLPINEVLIKSDIFENLTTSRITNDLNELYFTYRLLGIIKDLSKKLNTDVIVEMEGKYLK